MRLRVPPGIAVSGMESSRSHIYSHINISRSHLDILWIAMKHLDIRWISRSHLNIHCVCRSHLLYISQSESTMDNKIGREHDFSIARVCDPRKDFIVGVNFTSPED